MSLSLRCKSLQDIVSELSVPIATSSEGFSEVHGSGDWCLSHEQRRESMSESHNILYGLWLDSRTLSHKSVAHEHLAPGANRPLTSHNFRAAGKIIKLCSWDLVSRLFALHPLRTTLLVSFELLRGLFPAARGYSQALILNELQTLVSSGHLTWSHLLKIFGTELCRMGLESIVDSFASSNENIVHGSARFFMEHKQLEQRLRLDVPTLSDPVVRDLLQESDIFVRSFGAMSTFGLFSPFDLTRILTLFSELVSHILILSTLTLNYSHITVLMLSVFSSSFPFILAWCGNGRSYFQDTTSPQQTNAAEKQEKMRFMAYSDSYRPEIILFGLGPWILQTWTRARIRLLRLERRRGAGNDTAGSFLLSHLDVHGLLSAFQNIPLILVLQTSSASLGSLTMYTNSIQGIFYTIGSLLRTVQKAFQSIFLLGAFYAAMELQPHLHPQNGTKTPFEPITGGMKIEAKNLSFTYPGSTDPALKDVTFTLEAGDTLAIVGYNGSGKSTLAHILLRISDFDQGELLINGIDIRTLAPANYHARVSAVLQGFSKFNNTVQENIGFGYFQDLQNSASIEKAARLAGADALVKSLPMGLKTKLAVAGHDPFDYCTSSPRSCVTESQQKGLSGGEWQRIALSRAFLRAQRPEVDLLLFDEPTSSLDAHAQNHVFDTVESLSRTETGERKKTVIFITHRLSTARRADKIAMMKNGTLAEFGTHKELLRRGGLYAALYKASI